MKQPNLSAARAWLEALEWDGTDRVSTWLTDYLGAADTAATRQIGGLWLHQAVNRLVNPGSQAEYVLVLEGQQGIGKSSALRALAGPWFSDAPLDLSSKDAILAIADSWIHEIAEPGAHMEASASSLKAFITARQDRYRPPYGTRTVIRPRRVVFAATCNDFSHIRRPALSRRWLPVSCTRVQLDLIRATREQLFAQALHEITPSRAVANH